MLDSLKPRIRSIWSPDMYHGWTRIKNYFEGWYFKIVDPKEQYAFAIIPGISLGPNGDNHAFIQVLDGKACKAYYYPYPTDAFIPHKERFEVRVGNNHFSEKAITLDLPVLTGQLRLSDTTPWPKSFGAPGIMGWYSFVPFMQCYHGVVSLNSKLSGQMVINGQEGATSFDGGKAYIEKDWGTSFPKSWIWMQSNHFDHPAASFMFSLAHIPWLGSYFNGFIGGLWLDGQLYKFATYTGAKVKGQAHDQTVNISVTQKHLTLDIHAEHKGGGALVSPVSGAMTGKVDESLQSTIQISLKEGNQVLFEGTGKHAGLELAGDIDGLL